MDEGEEERTLEIYKALMGGDHEKVIQLCQQTQKGGLHSLTIHGSTVLHMAAYAKENKLVIDLLNLVPVNHYDDIICQSDCGNTILHEAATSNYHIPAAKEMLRISPALLIVHNERGETPLFRAVSYGKCRMFTFLDAEVNKVVGSDQVRLRKFLVRDDKTTILHAAIVTEHFDLALRIAKKYSYLTPEQDSDGMTALQLLACNPSAFKSGTSLNLLERLVYSRVLIKESPAAKKDKRICKWPFLNEIRKKKKRYESALKLATFLIERDRTWGVTGSAEGKSLPKIHKYVKVLLDKNKGKEPNTETDQTNNNHLIPQTPLLLATKYGCTEIVKGILDKHPQAVSHVDYLGRNILHVAIKHRQIQIFDIVEKKKISMRKLKQKLDKDGNSILHMVGAKTEEHIHRDMRSPAVILQEDLLLFERIKNISATHHTKHLNSKGKTAEMLLSESNVQLHKDAKEWMKRTAENCSIVAVLIATVAFAAAYTVPGGPNDKGFPVLENNPFFSLFTITDVLSLGFALTSVITFLSILTSPFRLKDFRQSLPQKLMLGVTMLILSVSMMMLAFAATIILMIRNKEKWTRISLYSVAFFPVTVFVVSYFPLYLSLMETFKYSVVKIGSFIPRFRTRIIFVKSEASVDQECHSKSRSLGCLL